MPFVLTLPCHDLYIVYYILTISPYNHITFCAFKKLGMKTSVCYSCITEKPHVTSSKLPNPLLYREY